MYSLISLTPPGSVWTKSCKSLVWAEPLVPPTTLPAMSCGFFIEVSPLRLTSADGRIRDRQREVIALSARLGDCRRRLDHVEFLGVEPGQHARERQVDVTHFDTQIGGHEVHEVDAVALGLVVLREFEGCELQLGAKHKLAPRLGFVEQILALGTQGRRGQYREGEERRRGPSQSLQKAVITGRHGSLPI